MSDCQRWEPLDDSTMRQAADGGWVLIGDYSFLKREAHILRLTCQDLQSENARLKAEVERLTKAVMHSPAAQLKLKELEGKTTFEEINSMWGVVAPYVVPPCIDRYAAKEGKQP